MICCICKAFIQNFKLDWKVSKIKLDRKYKAIKTVKQEYKKTIKNVSKIWSYQYEQLHKICYLILHCDKHYRMMKYQIYEKKVVTVNPPQKIYCKSKMSFDKFCDEKFH